MRRSVPPREVTGCRRCQAAGRYRAFTSLGGNRWTRRDFRQRASCVFVDNGCTHEARTRVRSEDSTIASIAGPWVLAAHRGLRLRARAVKQRPSTAPSPPQHRLLRPRTHSPRNPRLNQLSGSRAHAVGLPRHGPLRRRGPRSIPLARAVTTVLLDGPRARHGPPGAAAPGGPCAGSQRSSPSRSPSKVFSSEQHQLNPRAHIHRRSDSRWDSPDGFTCWVLVGRWGLGRGRV
jgi:hypothetical protein